MGFQVPVSKFQGPDLALVNAPWAMSRLVPTPFEKHNHARLPPCEERPLCTDTASRYWSREEGAKIITSPRTGSRDR